MITSKSKLAIILSRLRKFAKPDAIREQYITESEIAAEILWFAYMNNDIKGKVIADLGCGTGILGIGCLLLGAEKVYFADYDIEALEVAEENITALDLKNAVIMRADVSRFNKKVDTVVQNPPFGVRVLHADREFLEKAFEISDTVYSFHKIESRQFIENFSKTHKFKPTHFFQFDFSLKATLNFHRKKVHHVLVGCWRIERENQSVYHYF